MAKFLLFGKWLGVGIIFSVEIDANGSFCLIVKGFK
jgi:hypothetical protein